MKKTVYEIKHDDSFSFMNSATNLKEWDFELRIREVSTNEYEACYSKELAHCLYKLDGLRKDEISLESEGVCFNYQLKKDNEIEILNKKNVIAQLEELKALEFPDLSKKDRKSLLSNVDFYIEYLDELDKDLARELTLIHEFDGMDIPIGVSGMVEDQNDKIDLEKLEDDELEFLEKVKWETVQQVRLYQTPAIDDQIFLYDYLFGIDVLSADERADFGKITRKFFDKDFSIYDYENVTLNRDQRKLDQTTKKLNYLLKERKTSSPKMKKLGKLEIKKKE